MNKDQRVHAKTVDATYTVPKHLDFSGPAAALARRWGTGDRGARGGSRHAASAVAAPDPQPHPARATGHGPRPARRARRVPLRIHHAARRHAAGARRRARVRVAAPRGRIDQGRAASARGEAPRPARRDQRSRRGSDRASRRASGSSAACAHRAGRVKAGARSGEAVVGHGCEACRKRASHHTIGGCQ